MAVKKAASEKGATKTAKSKIPQTKKKGEEKKPKKPFRKITTQKCIAAFAYVNEPDTEGKFADGKFKITMKWEKDQDISALETAINEVAAESFPDIDPSDIKLPLKDGDESEKDDYQGFITATAKTKDRPKLIDAKRNPLPAKVKIFSGDVVKVAVTVAGYESTEKVVEKVNGKRVEKTEKVYGVTLYLDAVQLIEKNNGTGGNAASRFDDEDGFDGSEHSDDDTGEDQTDESSSGGDDDDL